VASALAEVTSRSGNDYPIVIARQAALNAIRGCIRVVSVTCVWREKGPQGVADNNRI
jgi:hypothetical protein